MSQIPSSTQNWWMYHGDPAHTGFVASGSQITSANIGKSLKLLHEIQLQGPVLSTPAIVDGYVYVGTANSHAIKTANGGSFFKINLQTGVSEVFNWEIPLDERDTHGFTGMGCTPAVANGKIYFSAFNGKLYCLDQNTLQCVWFTDLRHADLPQNQPANNILGMAEGNPPVAGWSSPVVAQGRVYVGMGEGENPDAYGFVYCLDGETGKVIWLYCTCQFQTGQPNQPNVLPSDIADSSTLPPGFSIFSGTPVVKGCSVWAGIAYDEDLGRLYCSTGNPQPDGSLPTDGYSNGLLVLDASSGQFVGFRQFPAESSYRPSDLDVDVGGSATLFIRQGKKVVGIGCKNGCYMVLDADTLEPVAPFRQLLPLYNNGGQIPTVDRHGLDDPNNPNPNVTNEESNTPDLPNVDYENYSGTYSTAAIHPGTQRLFIGVGGNNYHLLAPGIDTDTTPFLRALDWNTLQDAWPMDDNDPKRYTKARPPMYTNATESGLSVPAVVNDVVFFATTQIALYAFAVSDGTLLWSDNLGAETAGYNGGYGYCMGPAVWGNYVVAGALVYGRDGGVLKIYNLQSASS